MPGLLVAEPSSTLSNLLIRTLRAGGHAATTVTHDFDEARRLIADSLGNRRPFDALIVGVPARSGENIKPMLAYLRDEATGRLPLLLVVHDKNPVLERWVDERGFAEIVPWQRFSRIPGVLQQMVPEGGAETEGSEAAETQRVSILFVDDSQSARYAYRQLLESRGFPVQVAASVGEAEQRATQGTYDLIIVDYYLPDGTGDELCRKLRRNPATENATLAIITGSYKETIIKQCLEAGAVECMFKNEAKELFITRITSLARSIESQNSVEAERQRLDGILASVGDGVFGVDLDGRITFVNPTGAKLLGHREERELVGRDAAEVFHHGSDGQGHDAALERSYASGERLRGYETVFRHADGRGLPVECTAFPLSIAQQRQGSVVVFRDISERKNVEQLRWEVSHDSLTGLSNRRHFSQFLERELERLREAGGYDAMLLIDIDRFGDIVEAAGESEGDRILAEVSSKLANRLRDNDQLARLEADKFALLLSGIQLPNVFTIADAFRSVLSETRYDFHGIERSVTGSIGVVILSRQTPSAEYALEYARVACESAKKKGRNQTYIYVSEEDTRTARELESGWSDRFKDAVRKDRFVFLAQPIVPTDAVAANLDGDGELTEAEGEPEANDELIFELLLRMVSKDGQWISPSVFVPLAERVNMVQEIDLWVIRNALDRLEALNHSRYTVCLTVNLSNVTLQDADTLTLIKDVIQARTAVDPSRLIFEVTETAEIASLHNARKFMNELKKLGCRFALDDFGTGFSSFSHLKHLPVDFIKIDGMFVQAMTSDVVDRTVVNSITSMSHTLGLKTIAEHVESENTLIAARKSGVDYVQGNFLGEPMLLDNLDLEGQFG